VCQFVIETNLYGGTQEQNKGVSKLEGKIAINPLQMHPQAKKENLKSYGIP
jgi:hypothetical protein